MFVLPALILPLIFGLAITRLYQIPRKLWLGELQLAGKQQIYLSTVTIAAYLALFSYTALLGAALFQAVFIAENRLNAYLSVAVYVGAYGSSSFPMELDLTPTKPLSGHRAARLARTVRLAGA